MLKRIIRLGNNRITHKKRIALSNRLLITQQRLFGQLLWLPGEKPKQIGGVHAEGHDSISIVRCDAFTDRRHVMRQVRVNLDAAKPRRPLANMLGDRLRRRRTSIQPLGIQDKRNAANGRTLLRRPRLNPPIHRIRYVQGRSHGAYYRQTTSSASIWIYGFMDQFASASRGPAPLRGPITPLLSKKSIIRDAWLYPMRTRCWSSEGHLHRPPEKICGDGQFSRLEISAQKSEVPLRRSVFDRNATVRGRGDAMRTVTSSAQRCGLCRQAQRRDDRRSRPPPQFRRRPRPPQAFRTGRQSPSPPDRRSRTARASTRRNGRC